MAFVPSFNIYSSSDGLTGIVEDTTDYTNDENITVDDFSSREVVILDAYGEDFTTVTFSGSELEAEFDIGDINLWANSTMTWTGINPVGDYTETLDFPLGRITQNNYQRLVKLGCCTAPNVEEALGQADIFIRSADISASGGVSVGWQTAMDSANTYLRSAYIGF